METRTRTLLWIGCAAVAGAVIAAGAAGIFIANDGADLAVLAPTWTVCLNERYVDTGSLGDPWKGTFDDHTYHSLSGFTEEEDLACSATPATLLNADFVWVNLESNPRQGGVHQADDDLLVSFDLEGAGIPVDSTVEDVRLRVWAYPSDWTRLIQAGRWQDAPEHYGPVAGSAPENVESQLGNVNEYGATDPALPAVYSNDQLRSDVELAAGGDFVVWLQTTCKSEMKSDMDCGALVDKIDLLVNFTAPK